MARTAFEKDLEASSLAECVYAAGEAGKEYTRSDLTASLEERHRVMYPSASPEEESRAIEGAVRVGKASVLAKGVSGQEDAEAWLMQFCF